MPKHIPLILKTLQGEPTKRPGVWLMRQAGRYLPEYRALRQQAGSFSTLCKTPELACQATLQPLARFALDAAIIFSDILTVVDAMGHPVNFIEHTGPVITDPIRSVQAVNQLPIPDVSSSLDYVFKAIALVRKDLPSTLPLIGFSGSPWTLATYLLEGGTSKNFSMIKGFRYTHPQATHQLLHKLTTTIIAYCQAQVDAGADIIMLFDTWGGILTHTDFREYSLDYLKKIISALAASHPTIPIIVFTKGGNGWLADIAQSGAQAIGIDWTCDLHTARQKVGPNITLQGNLDPCVLLAPPQAVVSATQAILAQPGLDQRFIFNLGHGILPQTPIENVHALLETIHQHHFEKLQT